MEPTTHAEMIARWKAARQRMGCPTSKPIPIKYPTFEISLSGAASGRMWLGMDTDSPEFHALKAWDILSALIAETGVSAHDLRGPWRRRHIVRARQLGYWFMRRHTRLSFPAIGRFFGNKTHQAIMHGVDKVNWRRKDFEPELSRIAARLNVMT